MAQPIKIIGYHKVPRSAKIILAAKAGGVPFTHYDIEFGVDNETPAFLLNCHPCGRVPVLDCGSDGYLFESGAIFRHVLRLADKAGKSFYGRNTIEASQVDQWFDFVAIEFDATAFIMWGRTVGYYGHLTEEEMKQKITNLHESFHGLDNWLETRTFLVGERLSGADLAFVNSLEIVLFLNADFWKYRNVVRFYHTVFYSSPAIAEAQKYCGGAGFPVEKPKEAPKEKPAAAPKEKPAAAAAAASSGAGGDDDEGDDAPVEVKPKNELDELPPSPFVLDAFKREYSNNKDTRNSVAEYLWKNFDKAGWTMWFCKYKYNDELQKPFMTSNLVRGWFQRMEGVRKYAFGVALITGTEAKHEIRAYWILRSGEIPKCVAEVDDTVNFDWRKADLEADKATIIDFLCWEGKTVDPVLEGRCFK